MKAKKLKQISEEINKKLKKKYFCIMKKKKIYSIKFR